MEENNAENGQSPASLPERKIFSGMSEEELAEFADKPEETAKEKKEREAAERKQKLKEYGGSVSLCKLLSLADPLELCMLGVAILGAVVHGLAQPLICLSFGNFVDALSVAQLSTVDLYSFLDKISGIAIEFSLIGVGVTAFGTIQGMMFPWFAETQLRKMRLIYLDAALHRDVSWYDMHDCGAFATEMADDLARYEEGFGNLLGASFMAIGTMIAGFIIGIYLAWQVGLVMIVSVPVMGVGGVVMGQAFMDMQQETQGAYVRGASIVNEVLFAVRTVVSFGAERRELARYGEQIEIARKGGLKNRAKIGIGMGYIWMAFFASVALAFYFGATLLYSGVQVSVGKLLASFFAVITAGFTMGQIPPGFAALYQCKYMMARFFYIKDHDMEIQRRLVDNRKQMGPIESLRLQGVHFSYPARPDIRVLYDLTLDIQKGQKVAIVGESGSGKSTVMALLERFYDPLQGQVLVNGEDLKLFSVKSFRQQIGYVGQEPVLFATSIKANIMQSKVDATDDEVRAVAKMAQLDFVKQLPEGFDTFVGAGGSQFSGGQKQRIAIARALLKKPSVLLLDEATSALDSKSERMIQTTIDKIGSERGMGMTMVSIAHRLSTVKNSDVIYVLQGGELAETGTHQELMRKPDGLYLALAAAQNMSEEEDAQGQNAQTREMERKVSTESGDNMKKAKTDVEASKEAEKEEEERKKAIQKTYKVPMLRLLSFCRPEWGWFVPGFLGALASGACFPIMASLIMVDAMLAFFQPDREVMMKEIKTTSLYFLLFGALKWLGTISQFVSFGMMGEAMTKRCRLAMLTQMLRQEIGFHDDPQNTPGKLERALQTWAYRVQVLCVSLGDKADALCCVFVGLGIGFYSCWEQTLVMFLAIPVFVASQTIQMMVLMGGSQKANDKMKTAQQVVADAIMNVRTVQASGCEKSLLALYSQYIKPRSFVADLKAYGSMGFGFGLSQAVMFWILAGAFWFMGVLIREGRTDFANGQRAFMGVLYAGLGSAMAMTVTGNVGAARVAAHDMFELLDTKSKIDGLDPDGTKPKEEGQQIGRFEFQNVKFYYPFRVDVQVLKDVSFTIEAGQSVGVVGPSGSGKTTLFAMIQRFYDPQSGAVLIGQEKLALNTVDIRWWRRQVGFVGQEPILFDTTVLENVKYGLDNEEVSDRHLANCKQMASLNFLDGVHGKGWETRVGPRGMRLSGGQKQRVAICRALVRDPPVLLFDEATSALDTKSEKLVQHALEKARRGRTSFAIAHRLSTIKDCDVILVVADGVVAEKGTHDELLALNGVYAKLQAQASSKVETKDVGTVEV